MSGQYRFFLAPLPGCPPEIVEEYRIAAAQSPTLDSGFDLRLPEDLRLTDDLDQCRVDHQVVGQMVHTPTGRVAPWTLLPRSSLSKTRLRLANSEGVMDIPYTGPAIAALDVLPGETAPLRHPAGSRLVQVLAPDRWPFPVTLCTVEEIRARLEAEHGATTRGTGGFGSTGH